MANFSDRIRSAGAHVKGAYGAGKEYINQHQRDYAGTHGNLPSAKEYVTSDAGRATARMAGGTAINKFLERGAKSGRSGFLKTALFSFAHIAFQGTMNRLRNDQRVFENIAKVKRGDPEVKQMSHTQLREVWDHAHKYGGPHADHIRQATTGELDRRQTQKNAEHVKGLKSKHEAVAAHKAEVRAHDYAARESLRKEAHQQRLQRLRETHSVAQASQYERAKAKIAAQEALNRTKAEGEASKTKGTRDRQKSIRQTVREKEKLQILKMNPSGSATVKTKAGGTRTASKAEVQASRKSTPTKARTTGGVKVVAHSRGARSRR